MTGRHFLGCASCGTYDRHNSIVQIIFEFLRVEWGFTGRINTVEGSHVGSSGNSERHTDGQVHESPHTQARIAFDVSTAEPNSNSHLKRRGCNQSFLNVNAGTRDAERAKVEKYKGLCTQRPRTNTICPPSSSQPAGAWESNSSDCFGIHTGRELRPRTLRWA